MSDLIDTFLEQIDKFCLAQIKPTAAEDDEAARFRPEIFQGLADLGLAGMGTGEGFGGGQLSCYHQCLALAQVAKYSVSYAATFSVTIMTQSIIERFGNSEQKAQYLEKLALGQEIGAFCLTEPGAGSDAASLATKAKDCGDHYELTGTKMFITSGSVAKTFIVMARTGGPGSKGISAFVIGDNTPGMKVGKVEDKMGWRSSPTTEIIFEKAKVPKSALLGKEGDGLKVALSGLDKGRITIGSIGVGVAEQALSEAIAFSHIRKQFGQAIYDFQGLQFMIADMATELEASRLLVKEAARLIDSGKPSSKIASMAKMKATDMSMRVTTDALQILGGVGYTKEYPLERYMRDAKVLQILEGTNQIQKVVIARKLRDEFEHKI